MSANRLFLVCAHHPQPEHALALAERSGNDVPYLVAKLKRADDWFTKHMACGHGCDHFQLAYGSTRDWDTALPAAPPEASVRLALLNGAPHE